MSAGSRIPANPVGHDPPAPGVTTAPAAGCAGAPAWATGAGSTVPRTFGVAGVVEELVAAAEACAEDKTGAVAGPEVFGEDGGTAADAAAGDDEASVAAAGVEGGEAAVFAS